MNVGGVGGRVDEDLEMNRPGAQKGEGDANRGDGREEG